MAKLPFLLFRSLRLSHNSTCLCIEKCVRQSGKYVLSHREDDEALRIYMDRMRTESGVTRFTLTPSQEDMKKLEEFLKAKMDK